MEEMLAMLLGVIPESSVLTPYVRQDKLLIPVYFHRVVTNDDYSYLSDLSRLFEITFVVAQEVSKSNMSIRRIECY